MTASVIAVAHPGKIGDALYALPTVRYLCERHGGQADFYTSSYCAPLTKLLLQQPCIRKVIIPKDYEIEHMFRGVQPWKMPLPEKDYAAVYQLGFQQDPDRPIHDFIADRVDAPAGLPITYDFPDQPTLNEPYLVLAPGRAIQFRKTFLDIIKRSQIKCVIIGGREEFLGEGLDRTGLDLVETLPWIAHAQGFIGVMSSQLVLANAFPIPKVVLHDGVTWDLRHVIQGPLNYYPVNPTALEVLLLLRQITFSKTLNPRDYLWIGEAQHIKTVVQNLRNIPVRFEHAHRLWEYGLSLKALREIGARKILDVGGGGSAFAPAAAWLGIEVTQVDPCPAGEAVQHQSQVLGLPLRYVQQDFLDFQSKERFDAVTCLSVIEHVQRDHDFFQKLLSYIKPGGLLILTTDFHPSGQALVAGHLRTYNQQSLLALADSARAEGFDYFGQRPNYLWLGSFVNSYNFASLILRKA